MTCATLQALAPDRATAIRKAPAAINGRIGARIRHARKARRLTLENVAHDTGLAIGRLHKYETAANRIPAFAIVLIAEALAVSPAEFFTTPEQETQS